MARLDGNERLSDAWRGGVVALGNFDGFHKGHQAVVGRAVALAKERGCPLLFVGNDFTLTDVTPA